MGTKEKLPYIAKGIRNVMGTFVTITVVHPYAEEAKEAVSVAFEEMYRIDALMSVYKENSQVSILNRNGFYEGASADVIQVIKRASYYSELSDGAFDITVMPLLQVWEERQRRGKVATDAEMSKRLELVSYQNIVTEGNNIIFRKAGMGVTLAGIAKGYAVDKAIEALNQRNIGHALVNAGGDIRVIGGKTEVMPWRITVRNPKNKSQFVAEVELRDQAIATSGTYQRYLNDMINPRLGKPSQGVLSSTVVANKAIDADALSTAVLVLGAGRGMDLVRRLDSVEALVITKEGKILKSDSWASTSADSELVQALTLIRL